MTQRIPFNKAGMEAMQGLFTLGRYLAGCGLEPKLQELVKMRASMINGCAYCIDMHWKDARAAGETEQRLYGVAAWEEAPYYSDRERAALLWTDAVTKIGEGHVPDEVYEEVRQHFSEKELMDLDLAVVLINAWNRLAIPFRAEPGSYQRDQRVMAAAGS